ncbi:MAG TPA: hypothetical protein VNA16_05425, partial [Abditibacteriaceae bacterium]|nr:hypothetical protein [Abditibacteriaceae bacterium]
RKAQALFPKRKTFADQQCPDMGAVSYIMDGKPSTQVLIAVYAGKTRAEAQRVLAQAKKRYPNVKIRRMQVVFERIVQ